MRTEHFHYRKMAGYDCRTAIVDLEQHVNLLSTLVYKISRSVHKSFYMIM